jgi:haloacetate dehalogenase
MADYRANAEDVAQDLVAAEVKIACPVISLRGADFYAVRKMFDMPKVWGKRPAAPSPMRSRNAATCPQEEQPEVVTRLLVDFLANWKG